MDIGNRNSAPGNPREKGRLADDMGDEAEEIEEENTTNRPIAFTWPHLDAMLEFVLGLDHEPRLADWRNFRLLVSNGSSAVFYGSDANVLVGPLPPSMAVFDYRITRIESEVPTHGDMGGTSGARLFLVQRAHCRETGEG